LGGALLHRLHQLVAERAVAFGLGRDLLVRRGGLGRRGALAQAVERALEAAERAGLALDRRAAAPLVERAGAARHLGHRAAQRLLAWIGEVARVGALEHLPGAPSQGLLLLRQLAKARAGGVVEALVRGRELALEQLAQALRALAQRGELAPLLRVVAAAGDGPLDRLRRRPRGLSGGQRLGRVGLRLGGDPLQLLARVLQRAPAVAAEAGVVDRLERLV